MSVLAEKGEIKKTAELTGSAVNLNQNDNELPYCPHSLILRGCSLVYVGNNPPSIP